MKPVLTLILATILLLLSLDNHAYGGQYFHELLYNTNFSAKLTSLLVSSDGTSIYVGTDQGLIYFSHDSGNSWQEGIIGQASVTAYPDFGEGLEIWMPDLGRRDYAPKVQLPLTWMTTNSIHYQPDIGKVRAKDFSAYNYNIQKRRFSSSDPGNLLNAYLYSHQTSTIVNAMTEEQNGLFAFTNMGTFVSHDRGLIWYPTESRQFRQKNNNLNLLENYYSILPTGMAPAIAVVSDTRTYLLTTSQLYILRDFAPKAPAPLAVQLTDNLSWRLQNEPTIGQTINSTLERYRLSYDDIQRQKRTIRLSHLAPQIKFEANVASKYQTWTIGGFGRLKDIPHSAPILWKRKHDLGNKYMWNPTKLLNNLDTVADDDGFGYDITLVATWDFWGLVHDSRLQGKNWDRLQRTSYKIEEDVRLVYLERRQLMLELLYQPANYNKQLAIVIRLEELTTLLNQFTGNLFNPFNSLEYLEVLNEN